MARKHGKRNLMTVGLLVYLAVVAYIAYPKYDQSGNFVEFFTVIGITLGAIVLLWFLQTFRDKYREKANDNNPIAPQNKKQNQDIDQRNIKS